MVTSAQPLSVGLLGLDRHGLFHLERLSLRGDLVPVAVVADGHGRADLGEGFGCRVFEDRAEFLCDERIDLVLVTVAGNERMAAIRQVLLAGRSVAVLSPLSEDPAEAEALLAAAEESAGRLLVLSPGLGDDDFQAAHDQVQSGRLGCPMTLKHVTWGFAGAETTFGGLPEPFLVALEQLLVLSETGPSTVLARTLGGAGTSVGIGATVTMTSGVTADVEYHPSSPVPLRTGWVVVGSTGGYCGFEVYTATDDDEVYSTPVSVPPVDSGQIYDDLIAQWHDDAHQATVLQRAVRLAGLVHAVRRSLDLDAVVTLSD